MAFCRTPAPWIFALLIAGGGFTTPVQAAPAAAVSAPTRPLLLTDDLLDRMIAVARESKAIDARQARHDADDSDDDDDTEAPSIASMADRMDADPVARAMLARHGFTGRSYLLAMTTLAQAGAQARMAGTRWASKMPGATTVDPRNVAFYKQHTAKLATLAALNDPDYSPEEDARMTRELRSIEPGDLDDCVLLVPSVLSLTPYAVPGSAETSASSRIELAHATGQLAEHFHSERLKKDFTVMADEIVRHAHARRMESPSFDAALEDTRRWTADHCKGAEK